MDALQQDDSYEFAPSRGRELKSLHALIVSHAPHVRPLTGAGIEIDYLIALAGRRLVRPLTGAGIEIR